MQKVRGIWLPDGDTHFSEALEKSELYRACGSYQLRKLRKAMNVMRQLNQKFGTAVDVGAHVGLWTRVLADYFQRVIAYEPAPAALECLDLNTEDLRNVEVHMFAVASRSGTYRLAEVEKNSGNTGIAYGSTPGIQVQAVALDSHLDLDVDFMKIDVEGWEPEVLRGSELLIKRCRPVIVVEQKPGNNEKYGFDRNEAVRILKGWEATVYWRDAGDYCMGWSKK